MNRDIPGDSFTLEDIIKEFGGGKKNAAPEQTLPDGLSLSDIEQELRPPRAGRGSRNASRAGEAAGNGGDS